MTVAVSGRGAAPACVAAAVADPVYPQRLGPWPTPCPMTVTGYRQGTKFCHPSLNLPVTAVADDALTPTHHSPLPTHHSPFTTSHSPLTTYHSPLTTCTRPPVADSFGPGTRETPVLSGLVSGT
jgi:hypothetical protein